ncbi:MAG: nitroreductase family deazaflavin-dependent oxidoreductase [Candidatus Dormibacterales bacterium]
MLDFNQSVIDDFRSHGGEVTAGPMKGSPIVLLTTRGARSGKLRTTPVRYTRDGEHYVVIASKAGAPTHPAWYLNLRAHPEATVEVGTETFRATASFAEGEQRDRLFAQMASEAPSFDDYQRKTTRRIPVVLLQRDRASG